MNNDVIWLAPGAGAAAGLAGDLMSFRWITVVIASGAGVMGGIISNQRLTVTVGCCARDRDRFERLHSCRTRRESRLRIFKNHG
jgi:hypothetical protein